MSLNIFIYNNHNILVCIGKEHWPKQYVMVTTKHLQFWVNRTPERRGRGEVEPRSVTQGAGLAWFWQGRGPTSTHFNTLRVRLGYGHEPWPSNPIHGFSSSTLQSSFEQWDPNIFQLPKGTISWPRGSLLDFSLQPGVNPRQAVPISCGYSGGSVLGEYQRPWGSSQHPQLGLRGPSHFTTRTCLSPCFAQDRSQAASESRAASSSFFLPSTPILSITVCQKGRDPAVRGSRPPAGKKKDNLEIS